MTNCNIVVMPCTRKDRRRTYPGVRILVGTTGLASWQQVMDAIRCLQQHDDRFPKHSEYYHEDNGRTLVVRFEDLGNRNLEATIRHLKRHFFSVRAGMTLQRTGSFDLGKPHKKDQARIAGRRRECEADLKATG